jgi:hypothetical protein
VQFLLREITRRGMRRWRQGDHYAWGIAAAAAWMLRRALREPQPQTLFIRRGESLFIGPARPPRQSG